MVSAIVVCSNGMYYHKRKTTIDCFRFAAPRCCIGPSSALTTRQQDFGALEISDALAEAEAGVTGIAWFVHTSLRPAAIMHTGAM